jgi:ribosomal peptide maturation radical SAM protein 1
MISFALALEPGDAAQPPVLADPAALRVALVCMPFASADRPSIQLGLIGAITEAAGFSVDLHHFNLDLAAELSPLRYEQLCQIRAHMTGEWLFAPAAFGDAINLDDDCYLDAFPADAAWFESIGCDRAFVRDLRHRILPAFVDRCAASVDWDAYGVVGFSSLFQQNAASLALASRIKARHPAIRIVFGGANMEGEMGEECARAFPFIDHVVSGEGDKVFPALLHSIAGGVPPPAIPGLISNRTDGRVGGGHGGPIADLDALPTPNYRPYFARARELGLVDAYKETWVLPFESSRGCWWGQKHHCTFCGLNGLGMGFRAKSADRTLAELGELAEEHGICSFMAVDNILDLKYIDSLFGRLAEERVDFSFFYETKANLTRAQIKTMFDGGVRRVQPGIESLNSHVLKLMNKGCSMLQNIACLKWCRYYGIGVNWNLLWGFPGEREEDFAQELDVLKSITHFDPPVGGGRIWLERFSPNYEDRTVFPASDIRPEESYRYVYPAAVDLPRIAYFFDYRVDGTVPADVHRATCEHLDAWRKSWEEGPRPILAYRRTGTSILIDFVRSAEESGTYRITGANSLIYDYCSHVPRTADQVCRWLADLPEPQIFDAAEVTDALDAFCQARLMVTENGRYFGLALPANPNW